MRGPSGTGPQAHSPRGRYRFQGSLPLEPDAGLHPEMVGEQAATPVVGIPSSPSAAEDQQTILFLVRRLENFHDQVVAEMKDDEEASHSQIVSWTIDADRLYRARMLLESVDLE